MQNYFCTGYWYNHLDMTPDCGIAWQKLSQSSSSRGVFQRQQGKTALQVVTLYHAMHKLSPQAIVFLLLVGCEMMEPLAAHSRAVKL